MEFTDEQKQLILDVVGHLVTSFQLDVTDILTRENVNKALPMFDNPLFKSFVRAQLKSTFWSMR